MTSAGAERNASSIDGLPKQFVTSLRILFDILDEDRTGYVRLCDIESRWHEEGVRGLPSGVIESLRKVAPRNGRLSFENFVSGLKLSLLKTTTQPERSDSVTTSGKENKGPVIKDQTTPSHSKSQHRQQVDKFPSSLSHYGQPPSEGHKTNHAQPEKVSMLRPPSARLQPQMGTQVVVAPNTATVRPNNVLQSQNVDLRNQIYNREQIKQATVKFQNQGKSEQPINSAVIKQRSANQQQQNALKRHSDIGHQARKDIYIPSKPRPKSAAIIDSQKSNKDNLIQNGRSQEFPPGRPERPPPYRRVSDQDSPPAIPAHNTHGKIIHELKNWHRAQSTPGQGGQGGMPSRHSDSNLNEKNRYSYAGNDYVNIADIQKSKEAPPSQDAPGPGKATIRRQNSRRHTLSSGVDYNVIRRMKQLEKEKDLLLQGMEVVDRAREWYMKQIAMVTDKQHSAEKTTCTDKTLQSDQERVDFLSRRVMDVNTNLKALMDSSVTTIPAHMNLEVRHGVQTDELVIRRLKDQNKLLTQEVGTKSEKITQLEKEKASLIRDLFAVRSKNMSAFDDKTFL